MASPLLKWTGGKRGELSILQPLFPSFSTVVEPFAGGAAVSLSSDGARVVLNDTSSQLIRFYESVQDDGARAGLIALVSDIHNVRQNISKTVSSLSNTDINEFFVDSGKAVAFVGRSWPLWALGLPQAMVDQGKKDVEKSVKDKCLTRIPNLEKKRGSVFSVTERRQHFETAVQAGFYTLLRRLHNQENVLTLSQKINPLWDVASWFAVRALCYSGMFRFGKNGGLNVPYGGIGYNSRDFASNIKQWKQPDVLEVIKNTRLHNMDFEDLFKQYHYFDETCDFVFVDPPYDSAFSQYNKEGDFTQDDHKRLARVLAQTKAKWMLVIKNTPFILHLYDKPHMHHAVFGKEYQVNFRNRHDRGVEHLIVTNYPLMASEVVTLIKPSGYFS